MDPDVLLLNEATAALDLVSEAVVARATARLTRRRPTLVVVRRLTTAVGADRILVLDAGPSDESAVRRPSRLRPHPERRPACPAASSPSSSPATSSG